MAGDVAVKHSGVVTAWLLAGVVCAGSLTVFVAGLYASGLDAEKVALLLVPAAYAVLGLVIAVRQPGNRVAWVLLAVGAYPVLEGATALRIADPAEETSRWDVAAIIWANTGYFIALVIPLFLLLYIFPNGRFLSRRWVWAGWLAGCIAVVLVTVEGFARRVSHSSVDMTADNPIGFHDVAGLENAGIFALVFGVGLITLMLGGVPAIVVRYRRSSGVVRTQIKWVAYALVVSAIGLFLSIVLDLQGGWIGAVLFFLALAAPPLSVTIAITRHQLFDIDRLINRTVVYGLVVGALAALYGLSIFTLSQVLPLQGDLAVAVSTLAAAALFSPLRRRVQNEVDRRFYRTRYDSQLIAEGFAARLRDEVRQQAIISGWVQTVNQTVRPASAAVWMRRSDEIHPR